MEDVVNSFGCNVSPVDLRDYKLDKSLVGKTEFPEKFSAMTNHKVKHQGTVSSCVPHAVASILEFHDDYKTTLSTNFIYGLKNRLYGYKGKGEYIRVALAIAKDYGSPKKTLCNGNTEVEEVFEIADKAFNNKEVLEDAYRHRIKSYVKLCDDDDIKYALMNYGPVIISIKWFTGADCDKETGILVTDRKELKNYHAVVVYGWDSDGWLCQNSWGSLWGKHGLFKLPYDYGIEEAYGLIDDESLGSDYPEIIHPVRGSRLLEILFKILNSLINLVLGR